MEITPSLWWTFLLVFVRISSFMVSTPVFSGQQIPGTYKIGFSAALSIICVSMIKNPVHDVAEWTLFLLILKEFMVGIVIGMVANIMFYSVQLAGSLMDIQIGFSMASLFDPTFGTNTQLTGRLQNILAMLVLFTTNAHHLLIQGILSSFDWVSLQAFVPAWSDGQISSFLLKCLMQMFMLGFMMAAPIMGTLFVVDIAIGILARTVPQMNIFVIAPPIKILVYFALYILVLPGFFYLLNILLQTMFESMASILKIMGG
jgi:flagellar biosynthetic protein FliR